MDHKIQVYLYPHYPDAVSVSWFFIDQDLPGDFKVWVENCGSPEGPFVSLHELPIINKFEWIHQNRTTELLSKQKFLYYRIKLEHQNGKIWYSEPANLFGALKKKDWLIAKEINRKECVRLQKVGVPLAIFKKRHWGVECTYCRDKATEMRTKEWCLKCFGTGILGGFYPPIDTYGEIVPQGRVSDIDEQGFGGKDEHRAQIRLMNYPIINRDDVVVEKETNIRWNTWYRNFVEWRRVPVIQQAELSEIPPSSIRYRLSYDLTDISSNVIETVPKYGYNTSPWRKRNG